MGFRKRNSRRGIRKEQILNFENGPRLGGLDVARAADQYILNEGTDGDTPPTAMSSGFHPMVGNDSEA